MGNLYVRSTDGSDADNGTTWALAKATLAGAAAIDAGGDTIWVSQNHAETTAAPVLWNWAGTLANPTRIICGNDAAEPPTALATTGTVAVTGNNSLTIANTGVIWIYGLAFTVGAGDTLTDNIHLARGNVSSVIAESCSFVLASTNALSKILLTDNTSSRAHCHNCTFQFATTDQLLDAEISTEVVLTSCSLAGSAITRLISVGAGDQIMISGCNLSGGATTMNITDTTGAYSSRLMLRNCRLPASWSGSIMSGTPALGQICELHNSDSGDTNYRYQRKTQFGIIDSEIVNVRTGGASDGVTPLSWKLASNADTEWNHQTLDTGEIVRWNETVGSAITATIEILHDSVTNMTNQQIWLEVQYLGTSGFPLGAFINDSSGDYLSTAADQAASSETWNTTGLTNPNKQKLSVTFTPQEKGFLHCTIRLAQASKTVFLCPKIELS